MELRRLVCVGCGAEFVIGRCCYRGNQYCTRECWQKVRQESLRRTRAAHAASPKGRLNHRERENRRRQKRKRTEEEDAAEARKLTGQSSPGPPVSSKIENRSPSTDGAAKSSPIEEQAGLTSRGSGTGDAKHDANDPRSNGAVDACTKACCKCGAVGRVSKWEVRAGSGRRGVWVLVERLGARGRDLRHRSDTG